MRFLPRITSALLLFLTARVSAHSWVHCAEYVTSPDFTSNADYTDAKCSGFPRNFLTYMQFGNKFGGDRGINYQASTNAPICKDSFSPNAYSTQYPMATYTPGQKVRVVWPAKNHQADTCTNPYIPDTALKLYMNCGLTGARNPSRADFLSSATLVIDWKANGMKGFQNCPFFCADMDKSVCFEDFTVPNIPAGSICTFVWYWVFNAGSDPYTTCWEAAIGSGSGSAPTPAPTPAPTQDQTPSPTQGRITPSPTNGQITPSPTEGQFVPAPPPGGGGTCRKVWQQCGGQKYSGATCCRSGNKCQVLSNWYSQCWPNNWRQNAVNIESPHGQESKPSTGALVMLFVGSAAAGVVAVLAVGMLVYRFRSRNLVERSGINEVFIQMQPAQ